MEMVEVLSLLSRYGIFVLLVITFLESLNCPFMPAGVVLPAAGIFASHGEINILQAIAITIVGSMLGGFIMYVIGRVGGIPLLNWLKRRSERARKMAEKCEHFLQNGGFKTAFLGRVMPVVRTIFPIPAGAFRMKMGVFLTASLFGVVCYNSVCVGAGYFFASAFL